MEKYKPPDGFTQGYAAGRAFVRSLSYTQKLLTALVLLTASYGVVFLTKNTEYDYASNNCYPRTTFFPGLFRSRGNDYKIELRDEWKIGKVSVMATTNCVTPLESPTTTDKSYASVSLLGTPLFYQEYRIHPEPLPSFHLQPLESGVAATRPLKVSMSGSDITHVYQISANDKAVKCSSVVKALECDIRKLDLKQGTKYDVAIDRYFGKQKLTTVARKSITTLSPVNIVGTSIKPGETVYAKPTIIELKTDKKLTKAIAKLYRLEGDKQIEIAQKLALAGDGATMTLVDQLPRSSQYRLMLSDVEAQDGSSLQDPAFIIPFATSGGPKVTGVNIGRSGVSQNATVVITFDQPLLAAQDIVPLVSFKGGPAAITKQHNQIILRLSNMPLCGDFSITLAKDIKSEHDVSGDSAWSYGSRVICHTVSSIGSTAKGRAITAYHFGTGPTTILYVGATHGNEAGTHSLLSSWVDHLEANARSIPADKKIVVIPALNRDGLANKTRRNANNVDLNRNFPTADWKADVTMPGGEKVPNGGGATPLSEPESRAIASFTTALRPRLVLTYHSTGSLVSANEAGGSVGYAATYASLSRYWNAPKSSAATTFEYDTTGAYEDWLYEQPGIAALLVELSSHSASEFSRNQRAMWEMMK